MRETASQNPVLSRHFSAAHPLTSDSFVTKLNGHLSLFLSRFFSAPWIIYPRGDSQRTSNPRRTAHTYTHKSCVTRCCFFFLLRIFGVICLETHVFSWTWNWNFGWNDDYYTWKRVLLASWSFSGAWKIFLGIRHLAIVFARAWRKKKITLLCFLRDIRRLYYLVFT